MKDSPMTDWKLPWKASCRCGQVQMKVTEAPLLTMACHCGGCQKMTASAFSLSIAFPASGFTVEQGEPVIGALHGPHRHFYCGHCKSWLFTRPQGMDDMVNLRATMLDDHSWFAPWAETCTSEKLPWAITGARHSYETIPGPEVYGPLIAEFATQGPRPG